VDLTVGAGEEDEETVWQGKASVGSFGVWGKETKPGWGDWKICIVKLNKEKNPSEGAQPMRRIIARVDPSGAIVQVSPVAKAHSREGLIIAPSFRISR
jgi:hypothetical protein